MPPITLTLSYLSSTITVQDYAFMSCNLDTRAPIFDGTCATPESVVTPLVADPATGTMTPYLRQAGGVLRTSPRPTPNRGD